MIRSAVYAVTAALCVAAFGCGNDVDDHAPFAPACTDQRNCASGDVPVSGVGGQGSNGGGSIGSGGGSAPEPNGGQPAPGQPGSGGAGNAGDAGTTPVTPRGPDAGTTPVTPGGGSSTGGNDAGTSTGSRDDAGVSFSF